MCFGRCALEGRMNSKVNEIDSLPAQAQRITEVEVEAGISIRQDIFFDGGWLEGNRQMLNIFLFSRLVFLEL